MKPVVEVKNIGKSYMISHKQKADTLKDDIGNLLRHPFNKNRNSEREKFWALKDVSFEINKGEIFGIVGRNGSGKSTLLKILSRIVDPTRGSAILRGRTASLLEVGTGFHPELTGRENVYLNGSMLGLSRRQINERFNEIIEFSEIERFIDTPVKFYSSGMYVRLAFSVAAHLEPDILILDEVLSVGDAGFQQKSLKKILSSMEAGRTVIFVSHSMSAVQQLCSRGILLDNGHVVTHGLIGKVADKYLEIVRSGGSEEATASEWENDGRIKNDYFIPKKIYITDKAGKNIRKATANDTDKWINIEAEVLQENDEYTIGYMIKNEYKNLLYMSLASDVPDDKRQTLKKGHVKMRGKVPKHLLNEGRFKISLVGGIFNKFWIFDPESHNPSVELVIQGGLSQSPFWKNARSGMVAPDIEWEIS